MKIHLAYLRACDVFFQVNALFGAYSVRLADRKVAPFRKVVRET